MDTVIGEGFGHDVDIRDLCHKFKHKKALITTAADDNLFDSLLNFPVK